MPTIETPKRKSKVEFPEPGEKQKQEAAQTGEKLWTRAEALPLALTGCSSCKGLGMKVGKRGGVTACNCVLRTIFRICFNRFRHNLAQAEMGNGQGPIQTMGRGAGKAKRWVWGRQAEEYNADFYLVSKRALQDDSDGWNVFRFHFLLRADWKLCCKRLAMDRGNFFHAVYRVEQILGAAYRNVQPYALFPVDEYFGGVQRRENMRSGIRHGN